MFLFEKIIGLLCMPLSIAGLFLLAGMILLLASHRQTLAKALLIGGMLVLGTAWEPVANRLLGPLERLYPVLHDMEEVRDVGHIIVLGGGHITDERLPGTGQLSSASLARLIEGIRLLRLMENSRLVFTGGAVFDPVSHAQVMAKAAVSLGVDKGRIVLLEQGRDTVEEVLAVRELLGQERFVLVTSASHMPRAMFFFRSAGMQPVAAPTDHLIKDAGVSHPEDYFPSAAALRRTERALHEYLGLLWAAVYETGRLR